MFCFRCPAFKVINKSAENLFICGHIQCIEIYTNEDYFLLKAKCLPEMRKDRVYALKMALNLSSFNLNVIVLQAKDHKEAANM